MYQTPVYTDVIEFLLQIKFLEFLYQDYSGLPHHSYSLSKNKQIYLRRQNWTAEPPKKKKNPLNHNHATTVPPDPANRQPPKLQTTDPANPQPPNHRSGQPTTTQTPSHHLYDHPNTATTKNKKRGENRGDREKKGRVREIGERERERESTVIDEREKEEIFLLK